MRILLTGVNGQVGWELQRTLAPLGEVIAADRSRLDLADTAGIRSGVDAIAPDLIVNPAAYTSERRRAVGATPAPIDGHALRWGPLADVRARL